MNEKAPSRFTFDPAFPAEQSVVLRYARALLSGWLTEVDLLATSQREGLRLVELPSYRSVRLFLLDETTCTKTGTYKALDGCISTALCNKLGAAQVVFSSGANTGIALTDYGGTAELETLFFCPTTVLYKLDGALFARPSARLIAVEGPDRRVKEAARRFAETTGRPLIPRLPWRMLSAACRAFFLAEQMLRKGHRFDWLTQAVCAGYGPIGIYHALRSLADSAEIDPAWIPRFLGVQQAGLSPIVSAWAAGRSSLPPLRSRGWSEQPIEPTLYNAHPDQTYGQLFEVLKDCHGDMLAVSNDQFDRYAEDFVKLLAAAGIELTTIPVGGKPQYLEKAGLLGGAGTLKAIAEGRIRSGQTVLCALTGGAGPAPARPACPDHVIAVDASLEKAIDDLRKADHRRPTGTAA